MNINRKVLLENRYAHDYIVANASDAQQNNINSTFVLIVVSHALFIYLYL